MKDFIKQAAHVKPDANQLRLNDNDVKRLNEPGELIKKQLQDKSCLKAQQSDLKKIMKLHGLETDAVRILIVSSRDTPEINQIALY